MKRLPLLLSLALVCAVQPARAADQPKLTAEDVVARHLESIGTPAARAAIKSRSAQGSAQMALIVGGSDNAAGSGLMVSDGRRFVIAMQFTSGQQGGERFVFDGAKTQIAMLKPGVRSPLGEFFYTREDILKEGLLGGALMTSWSLLDIPGRRPQLKYEGLKQIDGRTLHDLSYTPRKGDRDLLIHLYFEPETFRHVKTIYTFTVARSMGNRRSFERDDTQYRIDETFSEFRTVDGLTLPGHWNLRYSRSGSSALVISYDVAVGPIAHNNVVE